ncbi:MAG: dihydrolipoyl dehydrogenase [Candidatus Makaraimicrobium thalassicum]|nr:MAG: dihydrolipoyl dehydrogenase [Candidatus Omnitrophota bacterium]
MKYDYLVIGSGPAGHVSAIRAAQLGLRVGIVEKDMAMLGGVCLNEGCIPAKSLYHSARVLDTVRRNPDLCGLEVRHGGIDMAGLVEKSRETARQLRNGLSFLFKKNSVDLIIGTARFVDKETVHVSGESGEASRVKAEKFLIATGSAPRPLPGIPFDRERVITSSQGIRLEKTPEKMLIVGGGAIGTEFASFFNTIGTGVSIVEIEDSLLPAEDREVSKRMRSIFKQKNIETLVSSRVKKVSVESGAVAVTIEGPDGETTEKYGLLLVSVGRIPSTSGLGLEKIGVATDDKGFIPVDERMRTNAENVYAAGDVLRTPMLAHLAYAEGEIAAETAAGQTSDPIDYSSVPNAVYSEVQAASVGMTEEKARSEGIDFRVGKQFFKSNGRAAVNSQTEGFIKIIADRDTGGLLGVHIIGYEAAESIHEFVVAKKAGLSVGDIAKTIHAHPTFSETAAEACRAVFGEAIHG